MNSYIQEQHLGLLETTSRGLYRATECEWCGTAIGAGDSFWFAKQTGIDYCTITCAENHRHEQAKARKAVAHGR